MSDVPRRPWEPKPPAPSLWQRRRTWLVAGAVLIVALLGVAIAFSAGGSDDDGETASGTEPAGTSSSSVDAGTAVATSVPSADAQPVGAGTTPDATAGVAPDAAVTTAAAPATPSEVATTVPADPAQAPPAEPTATSVLAPTEGVLALRNDGLAEVDFGADPQAAIDALAARLGPAESTTDPEPAPEGCVYGEATRTSFAGGTVTLTFADRRSDNPDAPLRPQLVAWRVGPGTAEGAAPPPVRTFEGTTLGTGVPVLRAAYGARLSAASESADGAVLVVDRDVPGRAFVLETTANTEAGTVTAMAAGSCVV